MKLQTQIFLETNGIEALTSELGIKVSHDEDTGLVIFNYDQIESPKTHPVVRECRGLILENNSWNFVARSFPRFFNWGEVIDEMKNFNFNEFVIDSKEDGSLCIIYYYNGNWHANTRGSFGKDHMQFQNFTWREAFIKALNVNSFNDLNNILDERLTYVCEFVSPWNKIVRKYDKPSMYLLTIFNGINELSWKEIDDEELRIKEHKLLFVRPNRYYFSSIDEIKLFLQSLESKDPTNEGVVIRDKDNRRWKIKSPTYLSLHRLRGEGNMYDPKNIIPFVLSGEADELLTYFPEIEDGFRKIESEIKESYITLNSLWNSTKHITDQKEFALAIMNKTPFTGILFQIRKSGEKLDSVWRNSGDKILKFLYK